jgi:hypothetical protein
MQERNGVAVGARVRDIDGNDLGHVKVLHETTFLTSKGPPVLFRRDWLIRYDEVRGMRDGALVVARSPRALFQLAEGELPATWRIPTPPDFPTAATPLEARGVFETLAAERAAMRAGAGAATARQAPEKATSGEEREAQEPSGEPLPGSPSAHHFH